MIKQETEGVQLTGLGKIGDEWKRFMGSFSLSTHKGLLIWAKSRFYYLVYVVLSIMGLRLGQEEGAREKWCNNVQMNVQC